MQETTWFWGGALGAMTGGKKKKKHALEGALALGLLTAIAEKKHKAYAYHVIMNNNSVIKILTEHKGIKSGDCVAIERGRSSNIRRVSDAYCEHPNHPVFAEQDVVQNAMDSAAECHQAKDLLMAAKTESEADLATKKVRVFCGHLTCIKVGVCFSIQLANISK